MAGKTCTILYPTCIIVGPLNKTKDIDKGALLYSYSSMLLLESFFSGSLRAMFSGAIWR